MNKKMKKYTALVTASTLSLAGCNSSTMEEPTIEQFPQMEYQDDDNDGLMSIQDSEHFQSCDEWMSYDDGSFKCIDDDSPLYAQHFFNGVMFATLGAMLGSSMYKSLNKKDGTERQQVINSGGGGGASSTSGSLNNSNNKNGNSDGSTGKSNTNVSNGSSSGKTGFGSGGSSRGGSSSS